MTNLIQQAVVQSHFKLFDNQQAKTKVRDYFSSSRSVWPNREGEKEKTITLSQTDLTRKNVFCSFSSQELSRHQSSLRLYRSILNMKVQSFDQLILVLHLHHHYYHLRLRRSNQWRNYLFALSKPFNYTVNCLEKDLKWTRNEVFRCRATLLRSGIEFSQTNSSDNSGEEWS